MNKILKKIDYFSWEKCPYFINLFTILGLLIVILLTEDPYKFQFHVFFDGLAIGLNLAAIALIAYKRLRNRLERYDHEMELSHEIRSRKD